MKAIVLISGGLDSILVARLLQREGIEIIPLYFAAPFSHNNTLSGTKQEKIVRENLGVQMIKVDIAREFLKIIESPQYGFGSNINPCIDCKILMLRKAGGLMKEYDAAFLVTGEVLGQRPMSQNKQSLLTIGKKSGFEGLILRPLSAKLLPETIPEKNGWVRKETLLAINGRTRKHQLRLAGELGVKGYLNPAGGCLLTDPEFAKKLKDLITHGELNLESIELLKTGRYFRLSEDTKLIVGRNEKENQRLEELARENDYLFKPKDTPGPTALGRGNFSVELIEAAREITGRYCDRNGQKEAEIIHFIKELS